MQAMPFPEMIMPEDLSHWTARPRPEHKPIEGRYVVLEPLDPVRHTSGLFEASDVPDGDQKFRWLPEYPPETETDFRGWVEKAAASKDPLFFAIVDKESGKVAGRQTLMRIDEANGVIEIGNIYWGPLISRKRGATEALYLFMKYVFDDLGYRRFEWKCNNDNIPSRQAALRFGFSEEGVFRQHLVVKGLNRDTAWFSMIDKEWPALKKGYEAWLAAENFEPSGEQKRKLGACLADAAKSGQS
jgi:RimJ/RimL family protein N-acetyltransferase